MIHIPMAIHAKGGSAQPAAINEAGVTESIGQYQPPFSNQDRDDADVG
jgi:hypothetical protein